MKLYGNIEKVEEMDDGTVEVGGFASSEDVDCDGEIIKADAMKAALPDYMKFANIREMHQPKAAGIALEAAVQDDGRTWLKAKIIDSEACKKVRTGVYKGFSIGGRVTSRDDLDKKIVTGVRLSEISLVDRPANPSALFEIWKGEGIQGETEMAIVDYDPEYIAKRDFSDKQRKEMADKKEAMPDGSFPIANVDDLENAIKAIGRAKDQEKAKAHIIARAKALGATDKLPEDWKGSTKDDKKDSKKAAAISNLKKSMEGKEVWDAGAALNALAQIMDLIASEESEDEDEKAQVALLQDACEKLKAFVASEIQEDHGAQSASVELAAKTEDLAKVQSDLTEKQTALAKMQDDLKASQDALSKMQTEKDDLQKKVEELGKMAAPTKGALKSVTVSKADDGADSQNKLEDLVKKAMENGSDATTALIKAVQSQRGVQI